MAKKKQDSLVKGRDIPLPESKILYLEPRTIMEQYNSKAKKDARVKQAEKDAEAAMKEARKKLDDDFQQSLKKGYGK